MKRQHVMRRLVPVDFLDLDGLELWLEAMAAKGLHLLKFRALFAQFQPGEPARVRYHAEPTMERRRDAVSNPVPGCGELGWSYVGKLGYLALFRTADPDAPEFHTDPVTQSYTLDQLTRRLTRFVWLLLAMMAVLTAFLVWARLDSSFGLVLDLVRYSSQRGLPGGSGPHHSFLLDGVGPVSSAEAAPGGHPPPAAPALAAHRIGAAELHPFIIHLRSSSNLLRHRLFCWSNEVGHGTLHPGPPRPGTFPSGAGWQGLHPGTLWVPRL